ncbi:cytochrome c3 family protein [Mucilaginibacter sp. KACC 22063]|uniref:cytochrome c3 family protein n=1 Tax=Mucilaginibacter sp. KACC 22063 TaxID=3025666 RepID=UPI0023650E49|nr:cytochrome c3 family protein [Mucilaginibacter sp. KACC 22063]WDF53772.1 cytochrome c3 family protein [Mucilaginibacter sp. KACC 22063]
MRLNKGKILILSIFSAFILAVLFSQCIKSSGKKDLRGNTYADETTCIKCHKEIYQTYHLTGHYHTSANITGNTLANNIKPESNAFEYDDSLKVNIEKDKAGIFQSAYFKNKPVRKERMDMAIGSGTRAQTYGYWNSNKLFEQPLSYYSFIHNWAGSPGFPNKLVYYDRPILTRCLECHASFVESHYVNTNQTLKVAEEFNKASMIYGIDCQRCHGPAAEHVKYQSDHPDDKQAKFIVRYADLPRERKVEMCAVCHSGNDLQVERSTFFYKPGDTLSRYLETDFGNTVEPDVHGSQAKLLAMSKCYLKSQTMTCTTCHSSHAQNNNNVVSYSQKCMTCHKTESHNFCKLAPQLGNAINTKCIDCHMPAQSSKLISYKKNRANTTSDYLLHTHRIAVYPAVTQQVIKLLTK